MNERTQDTLHYRDALTAMAQELGQQAFDNAMGGSMNPWYGVNTEVVAATLARVYIKNKDEVLEALGPLARGYQTHLQRLQAERFAK